MKKILYLPVVLVFAFGAFAQDTIVSKKGSKLIANVLEVEKRKTTVVFPGNEMTYELKNRKIAYISYEDSTKARFGTRAPKTMRRAYGMKAVIQHGMDQTIGIELMNPMIGLRYTKRIKNSRLYFSAAANLNLWNGVFRNQSNYVDTRVYTYFHENERYYIDNFGDYGAFNANQPFPNGGYKYGYNRYQGSSRFFSNGPKNAFVLNGEEQLNPDYHLPLNANNQVSKSAFQLDFGLRLYLRSDTKRWRPYVSAAIGVGSFDYAHTNTDIKFDQVVGHDVGRVRDLYLYNIDRTMRSAISLNQHGGFGFEWASYGKWAFSLEFIFSSYLFNMEPSTITMRYKDGDIQRINSLNNAGTFSTLFVPITISFKL